MPVRLTKPYNGQAANTVYWGTDEQELKSTGNADDLLELASDYQGQARTVTTATATVNRNAKIYNMNSSSAQTITVPTLGFYPVGTVLTFVQLGTGAFTIAAGTGVTISTALSSLISKGQYNIAQLIKTAPGVWVAFGGLGG